MSSWNCIKASYFKQYGRQPSQVSKVYYYREDIFVGTKQSSLAQSYLKNL